MTEPNGTRICEICNTTFTPKPKNQMSCSPECGLTRKRNIAREQQRIRHADPAMADHMMSIQARPDRLKPEHL